MTAGNQWLRKIGLIVGNGNNVLDLSQLEIEFTVKAGDFTAPNTAIIRIFNPQPSTIKSINTEFTQVSLQAGYQNGNYAVIFSGNIAQTKTGKLENVTRFLDIIAYDGDLFHSYGFVNTVIAPNQPKSAQFAAIQKTVENLGYKVDRSAASALAPTGGILPRGKVLFGLGVAHLNNLANTSAATWWIEQGVLKATPLTGYLPGQAIVINSNTGQIGVPEATEQGVRVKTLLNPLIKVGNTVKLNNNEITNTQVKQLGGYPNYGSLTFIATLDPSGLYTAIVVEHNGASRGNPFYSDLICLAIDQTTGQIPAF